MCRNQSSDWKLSSHFFVSAVHSASAKASCQAISSMVWNFSENKQTVPLYPEHPISRCRLSWSDDMLAALFSRASSSVLLLMESISRTSNCKPRCYTSWKREEAIGSRSTLLGCCSGTEIKLPLKKETLWSTMGP